MSAIATPILAQDIKALAEVAAILTPDMLKGLYLGVCWFSEEDEKKIAEAREIAKKYLS